MPDSPAESTPGSNSDDALLAKLGYTQELSRRMGGFSNYAVSLSIICILAGGVTSFSQGFCGAGGAAIGLGWPLVCLFSLAVAATMGQVASAFPTAGGLYHWAAILGGRGWGWATAWFNLAGLVTVLATINVGFVRYVAGVFDTPLSDAGLGLAVLLVTVSHALWNHLAPGWATRLTDFSGWWILGVSIVLTLSLGMAAERYEWGRLVTFTNFSGAAGGHVHPETAALPWLFLMGFLLPAYTLTGFDASAHVAEETHDAARSVPRGILRSVLVSGVFGWAMLVAVVLAMPSVDHAAREGERAFAWTLERTLPGWLATGLFVGIGVAQYFCGLATVTSTSRMVFAFARDGGLPCSAWFRRVSPRTRVPTGGIWGTAIAAILLALFVPYASIAAACAVLLYISYVVPTALGLLAHGRTWTEMGPWHLGAWYRPLAAISVLGCAGLLVIGVQPPNDRAVWIVGGVIVALFAGWWLHARAKFPGPPGMR